METYLIAHIGHTTKYSEHVVWWKPDSRGYTNCIDKAGRYAEDEARAICQSGLCIAVPASDVAALSRSTPYYRKTSGDLARLYDGGDIRPVPNTKDSWQRLLDLALKCCAKPDRPTPIGARARAIYLPPNAYAQDEAA